MNRQPAPDDGGSRSCRSASPSSSPIRPDGPGRSMSTRSCEPFHALTDRGVGSALLRIVVDVTGS